MQLNHVLIQVLAELEPITEADTILVNFGSWYNRLRLEEGAAHWEGWRADMQVDFGRWI